jgi:hypothetical protein
MENFLNNIVALLQQLVALLNAVVFPKKGNAATVPAGEILRYYGDLASGAIRPEDVRIEALTFRAIVNAAGEAVTTTPKVTVLSRYNLAIRRVYAGFLNPVFVGAANGLVKFNVMEQGRQYLIFKNPVTLSPIANTGRPYQWDGVYITVPGTDLETQWTVDQTLFVALVGASKIAEIVIEGDYIACGPQGV